MAGAIAVVRVNLGLDDHTQSTQGVGDDPVVADTTSQQPCLVTTVALGIPAGRPLESGTVAHGRVKAGIVRPFGEEERVIGGTIRTRDKLNVVPLAQVLTAREKVQQLAQVACIGNDVGAPEDGGRGVAPARLCRVSLLDGGDERREDVREARVPQLERLPVLHVRGHVYLPCRRTEARWRSCELTSILALER